MRPTPIPPSRYEFPPPSSWPDEDLIGVGADLDPSTVVDAYRRGLFPMHVSRKQLGWWSPMERGVLPLDRLIVSKSLRRSMRRYQITVDAAFTEVMTACGTVRRNGNWITREFVETYTWLHRARWAHSIEAWDDHGNLVGGLYGLHIDGLFAGESMFHTRTDASKVCLVHLVGHLARRKIALLDTQWQTPHLATLGVEPIPRPEYLRRLAAALSRPIMWSPDEPTQADPTQADPTQANPTART
ncbi:MAG: leucyl/phenylalanyl-tRNA--protein transferase [Acidimicrobiia bacterium]